MVKYFAINLFPDRMVTIIYTENEMGGVNLLPIGYVGETNSPLLDILTEKELKAHFSEQNGLIYLDIEGTNLKASVTIGTSIDTYFLISNGINMLKVEHHRTAKPAVLLRTYEPDILKTIENIKTPCHTYHLSQETKEDSLLYQNAERLLPSRLGASDIARGNAGRITVTNDDFPAEEIQEEGKWVITFENGSKALDRAWAQLVPLVKAGQIHKIKATPKRDDGVTTQALMIYTKKSLAHVCEVRNLIEAKGIDQQPGMKYIDFVSNQKPGVSRFDSRDAHFMKLLDRLTTHDYKLNGGGTTINKKTYSATAGSLVKKINSYLDACLRLPPLPLNEANRNCEHMRLQRALMHQITLELHGKDKITKGWRFFCLSGKAGARDESTAQLYHDLLSLHKSELSPESSHLESTPIPSK